MNVIVQYSLLIVFLALVSEYLETGEAYKVSRPYKYSHRKPWHRPRRYTYPRSSKYYRPKRRPSYHRGRYYRYRPAHDTADRPADAEPYTIVIQLPNRDERQDARLYHRNYDKQPAYVTDGDYIDEEEDVDARIFHVDNKKARIKVTKGENPKLHIKISRDDPGDDIEIIDKSNITAMDIPLEPKVYTNLTLSMQHSAEEWLAPKSSESELEEALED